MFYRLALPALLIGIGLSCSWMSVLQQSKALGLQGSSFGIVLAITGIGQLLSSTLMRKLASRVPRRLFVGAGALLPCMAWGFLAKNSSLEALVFAQFTVGFAYVAAYSIDAIAGAHAQSADKAKLFLRLSWVAGLSCVTGPFIAAAVSNSAALTAGFFFLALLSVLGLPPGKDAAAETSDKQKTSFTRLSGILLLTSFSLSLGYQWLGWFVPLFEACFITQRNFEESGAKDAKRPFYLN